MSSLLKGLIKKFIKAAVLAVDLTELPADVKKVIKDGLNVLLSHFDEVFAATNKVPEIDIHD